MKRYIDILGHYNYNQVNIHHTYIGKNNYDYCVDEGVSISVVLYCWIPYYCLFNNACYNYMTYNIFVGINYLTHKCSLLYDEGNSVCKTAYCLDDLAKY